MHSDHHLFTEVRDLIRGNNIQDALNAIRKFIDASEILKKDKTLIKDLTNIEGRHAEFKRSKNIGTNTQEQNAIEASKLRDSILSFVDEIKNKLDNKNKRDIQSLTKTLRPLVILPILIIALCSYYFLIVVPRNNQMTWLKDSGLFIIIEKNSGKDTINSMNEILKIVDCDFRKGEYYSLNFDLNGNNKKLAISLKQSFIDENSDIWQLKIDGWKRKRPIIDKERAVYIYTDPLTFDPTFIVNDT